MLKGEKTMTFGMCGGFDITEQIKNAGFDFFEPKLRDIATFDERVFCDTCEKIKKTGIVPKTVNCFFPNDLRLTGDVDFEKIKSFTDLALGRAKQMGVTVAVLGSGKSRNTPQGCSKAQALLQLAQVARLLGDIGESHGIKIALEPLRYEETDIVNTVRDGIDFCNAVNHKNVGLLVDFYHVFCNGEQLEISDDLVRCLTHVHIARPNVDRRVPTEADMPTLRQWSDFLARCGYDGTLSLEIKKGDDLNADLSSLTLLKEVF